MNQDNNIYVFDLVHSKREIGQLSATYLKSEGQGCGIIMRVWKIVRVKCFSVKKLFLLTPSPPRAILLHT